VRTGPSLRDLNHLVHFTQRFRAGLSWFAPAGLGFLFAEMAFEFCETAGPSTRDWIGKPIQSLGRDDSVMEIGSRDVAVTRP